MLSQMIADIFEMLGHTWILRGGNELAPDAEDIESFQDEAVKHLYNEQVGTRLSAGGMIVEKQEDNRYGVYVYVGSYN